VIDGEAVYCDGTGLAVFDKLHSRAYDDHVILYAFDLLELDGEDWRPRPLLQRKARLAKLLAKARISGFDPDRPPTVRRRIPMRHQFARTRPPTRFGPAGYSATQRTPCRR
jgi:ATP-dependent DNA ligase